MSLEVRRIALASPFTTGPARFVVGGQAGTNASGDVKMFEWDRVRGDLRMTGVQTDVGQIRAMAWSPHPTYAHLVACGLSSGRIHLVSLSPSTLTASLTPADPAGPSPTGTTAAAPVLSPKHARAVTALSFSPVDPNYLAAGLERHRSDSSLLIWDVHDALASLPADTRAGGDAHWSRPGQRLDTTTGVAGGSGSSGRHVQQYCPSEHVNSVAFMPSSYTVLASSNNKVVRLFDLRSPTPSGGAAAGASSTIGSGLGGTSSSSPRDPSSSTSGAVQSWLTRAVYNLTPDPTSASRFASWEPLGGGRGSVVRIWDTRRLADVLSFETGDGVLGLQWTREGLAVGTKDGGVGIWEVVHGTKKTEGEREEEWTTLGTMRQVIKPRPNLHSFAYAPADRGADVLVVGKDGALGIGPVTAAPAIGHSSRDDITMAAYQVQAVHSEEVPPVTDTSPRAAGKGSNPFRLSHGDAERILASRGLDQPSDRFPRTSTQATPDQMLSVIHRRAVLGYSPKDLLFNAALAAKSGDDSDLACVWEMADRITRVMDQSHSRSKNYDLTHAGVYTIWTSAGLSSSGGAIPAPASLRSAAGSSGQNRSSGSGGGASAGVDGGSEREPIRQGSAAWASLKQSQQHHGASRHAPHPNPSTQSTSGAAGSALSGGGGASAGPSRQHHPYRRYARSAAAGPPPPPDADFLASLESINASRDMLHPGAVGSQKLPPGDRPAARRMILALCGRGRVHIGSFSEDEGLVNEDQEDVNGDDVGGTKRSRAACWAWFEGDQEGAIRTLLDSPNSQHRLLASLVAAAAPRQASSGRKGSQQQTGMSGQPDWADIISGVDDPYIRAVLKRVSGQQSSPSVLCSDEAMHLVDRIGLACLLMNDRELADFLHGLWRKPLDSPSADLNYLFLTGLSPLALPLLQTYVDTTSDSQTAAIIASLIPPLPTDRPHSTGAGADAELMERWAETYRDVLDSWGLFSARVAYDVSRGSWAERLGAKRGSSGSTGQCPVCTHTLSHQEEELVKRKHAIRGAVSWPNERTNTCAYCSNPLPRCIICLQLVQSPHTRGYSASGQAHDDALLDSPHGMDTLDSMYVACQTCRHGGHANHVLAWFEGGLDADVPGHDVCAVKGCGCRCASI